MICPSCTQETPSARFCAHCGKPLPQTSCPQCGQDVQAGNRFCQLCGAVLTPPAPVTPAQPAEAAPKRPGNIGIVKGDLDMSTSTHIGSQNVFSGSFAGAVTIHMAPATPDAQEQAARGENLLALGQYTEAAGALRTAHSQDSANPRAGVLLALALLGGRNPAALPRNVIQQVAALLIPALAHQATRVLAAIILGVIQHDYYLANGMNEGKPSFEEVRRLAHPDDLSEQDRLLLQHLKSSLAARDELGIPS